ncbi:MAG TPA: DUF262 domain-containing protein [Flavipsychrobacter sp.]|nr:DUF262 domain-containing protein [Flavipsychrobacter sp.]
MKASETKIEKFLASNETTFAIPVYQRNYDWTLTQCKQLLQDIIEAGRDNKINAHFVGSIVYVHDDVYSASGLTELTIIDGQQRLTTVTLIYSALMRVAKDQNDMQRVLRLSKTYLINEFASEEEKLKLKPTDNNKEALRHILSATEQQYKGYSRIIENFNFFKSSINAGNAEVIHRGLSKLIFVDIALDRYRDNPQRIFESLNSTGLELSQADLIRNYILMGLKRSDQERVFREYWEVIERFAKDENINKSKVSDFIRDYLTFKNKEIPNKGEVYIKFKAQYPTTTVDTLTEVLNDLKRLAQHYNKLVNPSNEPDKEIKRQLEYIHKIEINVAYPFLMKVYDDFEEKVIDKQCLLEILSLIQTFTWRRFILGLPTNALNKIFMSLYDKVDKANYLYSVQKSLLSRTGVQRFPMDIETVTALKDKDVYNIKPKNRSYLFERLENFENNESVVIDGNDAITIEHIFPQNPDPRWKVEMESEEYNFIKENLLNTIGNLTLSGNNGKLGNKSFLEKKNMNDQGKEQGYIFSRLWLNRELKSFDNWNKNSIQHRADKIGERFLKIWELPKIEMQQVDDESEVNIFDAEDPTFKKLEYAVFFDNRLEVKEVAKLFVEVIRQLYELETEALLAHAVDSRIVLVKNEEKDRLRAPVEISDTYCVETGHSNKEKFERIKSLLTFFGFEDELSIKYLDEHILK